jgi:hypothetical protein
MEDAVCLQMTEAGDLLQAGVHDTAVSKQNRAFKSLPNISSRRPFSIILTYLLTELSPS